MIDALPIGTGIILASLLGAVLGSFIATLVLRWPEGRSVGGRSRCDGCDRPVAAWDLVPLLSFLWLRGRCRWCGAPIDPFHLGVEGAAAAIGAAALALMPGMGGWLWALFGWLLLPLVLLDARHFWLPDRLNLLLGAAGLLLAGPMMELPLLDRWIGALTGGVSLALLAWAYRRGRGRDGMGGGDPKLAAAIGAWTGWQALPLLLLLASLAGILWALANRHGSGADGKKDRPLALRPVPFGAFLGVAAWTAVPLWLWLSGR
ncbi:MAG: prepilin peptidase [Sphingopyxis macrogoltabida]|uniref:Prepilin leader peptidase/N-methyltransferase n=1 Tax=Sphingopyxis macrogoltabida TaxID=33050 RepID=A0A2W5L5Q0_SPHMC|nr:MAG: prepilin peptidase [Sphingopyxis macrogoltabida]